MNSIEESPCICIKCEGTVRFCTSNENEKRRHVAIVHGRETFSSLRCGKCQRKYFDFDHFSEHLETSPECRKDSWMVKPEPLTDHLETAFDALVEQMMRPINERIVKMGDTDQSETALPNGGNGDGKMDRTSGETPKRSMGPSMGMDEAKRRRVENTNATVGQSSTKRQRRSITRATNTIREGRGINIKEASVKIGRVRKTDRGKGQQRSNDADGSDGRGTGKVKHAESGPRRVNAKFKFRSATLRRKYCRGLIDKFSTAGKLQCQLCSVECLVFKESNAGLFKDTRHPTQHALRHLEKPIYRCRVCNITKFTIYGIVHHIRRYHRTSEEGYEDCSDRYHQEIMDTLRRCFYMDKKKSPVEQARNVPATPVKNSAIKCVTTGQFIDKDSPEHKFCLDLIAKYSTDGKLQCQLCSAVYTVIKGNDTNQKMVAGAIIQHTLGHLKKPIYHCRICDITKFTSSTIKHHIRMRHLGSDEGYEERADQYHQEILDTLRLCYQVDKEKCQVEQVSKVLAMPGRGYDDTRSPLHNERLHCVRSMAARYSNQTHIACQLCPKMCRTGTNNGMVSIRNHVFSHLNKDIFQCILCERGFHSYYPLMAHIQQYHQLETGIEGAYMDYSDKYHQEFMNMLGKCFDPDSGNEAVKLKKINSVISGGTQKRSMDGNKKTTCGTAEGF